MLPQRVGNVNISGVRDGGLAWKRGTGLLLILLGAGWAGSLSGAVRPRI